MHPSTKTIGSDVAPPRALQTRRPCLRYAFIAVALGLSWQVILVYTLYGGNWTSLFYHGYGPGLPKDPVFANTYVFPDEVGFDGQFYRVIAHDPFVHHAWNEYVIAPAMRYRRILVPALAWFLAFGQQRYIDATFIAVILLFVFLGVYWLGRYAALFDHNTAWGLAFLLAPASLAGLERAAIDVALTALTIGFALYLRARKPYLLFLVLLLAGLSRETGLLLTIGCAGAALARKNRRLLLLSCLSALPVLVWYAYVWRRIPADVGPAFTWLPFSELWGDFSHRNLDYITHGVLIVNTTYYLALLGVLLAFLLVLRHCVAYSKRPEGLVMFGFMILSALVQAPGLYSQVYHFGRVLAPLLLLLGLEYFSSGNWHKALPVCMVSPGALVVSVASAVRVLRHVVHRL